MTNPVQATIRWLDAADGGRKSIPAGPQYRTVARFEDERDRWPHEAWDLVVEFVRTLDQSGRVMLNRVCFN